MRKTLLDPARRRRRWPPRRCSRVGGTLSGPPRWTPGRALLPGALARAAGRGPRRGARARPSRARWAPSCAAATRTRSGDPDWVRYNAQFYERRIAVPLAAAALEPVAGDRAILDSRSPATSPRSSRSSACSCCASGCRSPPRSTLATVFLPALDDHSSYPAHRQLGAGARDGGARLRRSSCSQRGPRWLIPWTLLDPPPLVHARQHLDPDRSPRHGSASR